jgi:Na+-driven multidrug efflux pump
MPLGISYATTILIGIEMGKGNVKKAREYARLVKILGLIVSVILASILYFGSNIIAKTYSNIESVQVIHESLVHNIIPFLTIFDSL